MSTIITVNTPTLKFKASFNCDFCPKQNTALFSLRSHLFCMIWWFRHKPYIFWMQIIMADLLDHLDHLDHQDIPDKPDPLTTWTTWTTLREGWLRQIGWYFLGSHFQSKNLRCSFWELQTGLFEREIDTKEWFQGCIEKNQNKAHSSSQNSLKGRVTLPNRVHIHYKKMQHNFPKMRGAENHLEFFRKFIQIGAAILP